MIERQLNTTVLLHYRNLVEEIHRERLFGDAILHRVQQELAEQSLSTPEIKQLRQEAAEQIWYAPQMGRIYALIAQSAARTQDDDLLNAECLLTLGSALNAFGDFTQAISPLQEATQVFLTHKQPDRAARCESELVIAHAYRGEFEQAQAAIRRARERLAQSDDPLVGAYCDHAEGQLHILQSHYDETITFLHRAADTFTSLNFSGEAALVWCDLAITVRRTDLKDALNWLQKSRGIAAPEQHSIHDARCNYVQGLVYGTLNRYAECLGLYQRARWIFIDEGLDVLAGLCDLAQGVAYNSLTRYDEAFHAYRQARVYFADCAMKNYVALCDMNIAVVHYETNNYSAALDIYQHLTQEPLDEDDIMRAAHYHTNMGLCYDRLGRYDRALILHERARRAFSKAGNAVNAAMCQENLAGTYRHLGRYEASLEHCEQAREVFAQHQLPVDLARCDTYMADLHLALGQYEQAIVRLKEARATYEQQDIAVQMAACDREMARAWDKLDRVDEALELLSKAKAVFAESGLLVDAALCDLAQGEACLKLNNNAEAERFFRAALSTLDPAFPDEAWRARYGLGECALAQNDRPQTLRHWLSAVEMTNQTRASLTTERLSGGFFADRRQLFDDTLTLALELGQDEQALVVAEAAKAQTYLNWSDDRSWRSNIADDPYVSQLLSREEKLKRKMVTLRDELRLIQLKHSGPSLGSVEVLEHNQSKTLARLTQLSQEYEEVLEQLRINARRKFDVRSPKPFSVEAMRHAADSLTSRWVCLAYYMLDEDTLLIFYLDAQRLTVKKKMLNARERRALAQCANSAPDYRKMIYEGAVGQKNLRQVYQLVIPPEVSELDAHDLLIIAPHAQLHALPFHALLDGDTPLVNKVPSVVVPSLSAFESLAHDSNGNGEIKQALAFGLSDFGDQTRALPHTEKEIEALKNVLGSQLDVYWGSEATHDALTQLHQTGDLANYDVIHFATHTVLDPFAPSQSRVLLHDENLAVADILNLKLQARLVTLASCDGALGEQYAGDEIVGLAQAFFFAGARTVIASLWPVEDGSTSEFMSRFYKHLNMGESVARALRATQIEMAAEGYTPYQWAAFAAIGLP